jgi:hypothetical protein
MNTSMDDMRQLMEEFADEGHATASAEVAVAETEKRAHEQLPEAWDNFVRVVVTDKLQSEWRSLQRERRIDEAFETGHEKVSKWSRQAKAKLDERRAR